MCHIRERYESEPHHRSNEKTYKLILLVYCESQKIFTCFFILLEPVHMFSKTKLKYKIFITTVVCAAFV